MVPVPLPFPLSLSTESPVILGAFAATVSVFVGSLVALGYWIYEGATTRDDEPPTRREKAARTVVYAAVLAFAVGATVTPPDPVTQVVAYPPLFALALPVAYLLVFRDGAAGIRARLPGE